MGAYCKIRGLWGIVLLIFLCTPCYALNIPLAWDHDGDCTSFRVYRGFEGETGYPVLVGTVPCTEPYEFTDMDVPYGDLRWIVTAIKDDLESRPSNEATYAYYYPRVKYDVDTSGKILYKGENAVYAATDEDTTWVITKYYYDAHGRIIEIRVKEGAWTNRDQGW